MGFIDFITGAFSGASQFLANVVQMLIYVVNAIIRVLIVIVQALNYVFQFLLDSLKSLARFLKHVWEIGIKGVLGKLVGWVRTAQQWVELKLKPILQFLLRARQYLDRIYRLYIRPYLIFLQKLRRWLALLRLLHIKWAEQLDSRILKTERLLSGNFLRIRTVLNDIIGAVNSVAHPGRLSRMVAAAIFGRRTAAAAVRAITGLPIGFFFPNSAKGALPFEQPITHSRQLSDPTRNPSVSSLLGGLLPLPDSGFTETDPTPDDAELDSLESVPFFQQYADSLIASDTFYDSALELHVSVLEAIQQGTGPLASGARAIKLRL